MEAQLKYAALLFDHIREMFDQDSESFKMDVKELENEENFTAFIHAMSTLVPNKFWQLITKQELDPLEFNHQANKLVFSFCEIEK